MRLGGLPTSVSIVLAARKKVEPQMALKEAPVVAIGSWPKTDEAEAAA